MNAAQSHPDDNTPRRPFVNRLSLLARVRRHSLDPPQRHALLITGRDGVGKTTLLQHIAHTSDDALLCLYAPAPELAHNTRDAWLRWFVQQTNAIIAASGFSLSRIDAQFPPDNANADEDDADEKPLTFAQWFTTRYLPDVWQVIRPQRRLLWLFDDAQALLAVPELVPYLHELLHAHEQLAIVMTLNTQHDDDVQVLAPLVDATYAVRLFPLERAATTALLEHFAPHINEETITQIQAATGGHPTLLQRYGEALAPQWWDVSQREALDVATQEVYERSREEFRQRWLRLDQEAKLVLTAIATLLYDAPDTPVTPQHIEAWLAETEFPLDKFTINAALRGLDYRGIVRNTPQHVTLNATLMQRWLLDHARLDEITTQARHAGFRYLWVVIGGGLVVLGIAAWSLIQLLLG